MIKIWGLFLHGILGLEEPSGLKRGEYRVKKIYYESPTPWWKIGEDVYLTESEVSYESQKVVQFIFEVLKP